MTDYIRSKDASSDWPGVEEVLRQQIVALKSEIAALKAELAKLRPPLPLLSEEDEKVVQAAVENSQAWYNAAQDLKRYR